MTEGSVVAHLVAFSLPLMVGYIFQQAYNMVDSITVGKYASMTALAAVGSVGNISYTLIGAFMGLANGAGVVISQHFGAREDRRVHEAVHTAMVLALAFGVAFTVLGYFFAPAMLRLTNTPDDVFPEATEYLRIYFAGSIGLLVYNLGTGILNAVGDAKRPLYFLVASAVVNVVLDVWFVKYLRWGVAGVGWATVIAELVSAVLVVWTLMTSDESYRLEPLKMRIYRPMLRRIVQIGLPSSIQQMLVSFSNTFVQSYINSFQTACMAGWGAYTRIDAFTAVPQQALGLATTTFVGQNIGAGNRERAKKGTLVAFILTVASVGIVALALEIFAEPLIGLFVETDGADAAVAAETINYGVIFLRVISPLNLLLVGNSVLSGALRGVGDTKIPTVIQIMSFIVIRQIYLAIVSRMTTDPIFIGVGYPIGWGICSALLAVYYFCSGWEKRMLRVTDKSEE
ncbi:MAG: MATE family efflux transporter [Oscillospiraceae bacterium]|nr:MATE family efflux transporter [Oscillospiraceae bacterium]